VRSRAADSVQPPERYEFDLIEAGRPACRPDFSALRFLELPAVSAAAKVALVASAGGIRTFASLWRSCLIDNQRAAHQCAAIASLHGLCRYRVIVDLYESESSRFTTKTITKDINAIDMNTGLLEKGLDICFCSFVGQIPHEQLCH
jgi:hypothetical protein